MTAPLLTGGFHAEGVSSACAAYCCANENVYQQASLTIIRNKEEKFPAKPVHEVSTAHSLHDI